MPGLQPTDPRALRQSVRLEFLRERGQQRRELGDRLVERHGQTEFPQAIGVRRVGTVDVGAAVQAPVLPRPGRHWAADHHALDRWFWFRSQLPYLAERRFMPLATSGAFVRADTLRAHGGWDEASPDEGHELGIRLASAGIAQEAVDRPDLAGVAAAPRNLSQALRRESARLRGPLHTLSQNFPRSAPGQRLCLTLPRRSRKKRRCRTSA